MAGFEVRNRCLFNTSICKTILTITIQSHTTSGAINRSDAVVTPIKDVVINDPVTTRCGHAGVVYEIDIVSVPAAGRTPSTRRNINVAVMLHKWRYMFSNIMIILHLVYQTLTSAALQSWKRMCCFSSTRTPLIFSSASWNK